MHIHVHTHTHTFLNNTLTCSVLFGSFPKTLSTTACDTGSPVLMSLTVCCSICWFDIIAFGLTAIVATKLPLVANASGLQRKDKHHIQMTP